MERLRLIVDNAHDQSVSLTATTEAKPFSNTQGAKGHLREYPYRSSSVAVHTLTGIFPQTTIDGIVFTGVNFTQDAVVTVYLYLATVLVATVVIPANGTSTWRKWIDSTPADEFEITIDDTDNPAGYFDIRQLILGPKVELNYNFDRGMRFEDEDDVEHIRTAGRSLRSEGTRLSTLRASLDWTYLPESDRITLKDSLTLHGRAEPLFMSLFPEAGGRLETDHEFVCKRTSTFKTSLPGDSFWNTPTIDFEEA